MNEISDLYMTGYFKDDHAERDIENNSWMMFVRRLMNPIEVESSVA